MRHWPENLSAFALAAMTVALTGCREAPAPNSTPGYRPIGLQLQQQDDSLQDQRFRTLLDFEQEGDSVFVQPAGVTDTASAHTGNAALKVSGNVATLKVGSVLFGAKVPGPWTLIGAYVRPSNTSALRTILSDGQKPLAESRRTVQGGRWTFVSIDLTDAATAERVAAADPNSLQLRIEAREGSEMSLDDVLFVDNTRTLLNTLDRGPIGWSISRRGYTTVLDAPGRFKVSVVAAAASDKGWVLQEYSALRARLESNGPVKQWTLFSDGRSIQDGKFVAKGPAAEGAASHDNPGKLTIDESTGRLDRTTPGDADNDGYNEVRGAYQVQATAARVQLTLAPTGPALTIPFIEYAGLPAGTATVMVEGQVIDQTARLPDGRLLVRLPIRIEKPTTITLKVSSDKSP